MRSWRWYHIALIWIIALAGCIAIFRANAHVVEGKSDSGGIAGVGAPLSLVVACAVVLLVLILITALWIKTR